MRVALLAVAACAVDRRTPTRSPVIRLGSGAEPNCTGVLIGPRRVVTAGHCLSGVENHRKLFDTLGAPLTASITAYSVHDRATRSDSLHDIAVAYLDRPLEVDYARVPIDDDLSVGELVQVLLRAPTLPGPNYPSPAESRWGRMRLTALGRYRFTARPDPDAACGRDSGAPAMWGPHLVGIVSRGDAKCSTYTEFVRLSAYRQFVAACVGAP